MAPTTDPSQWTYTDYVCFLNSHGYHNLNTLNDYLEWGLNARSSPTVRQPEFSKTMLLEFTKASTRISDLSDLTKLRLLLREWTRSNKEPSSPGTGQPLGRIIMVENAAPALIDTLGGLLNIDPSFFASYLDDNTVGTIAAPNSREWFTIDYQIAFVPVNCPKEVEGFPLCSQGNYYRRVELIPKQPRQKIALTRRKISLYSRPSSQPTEPWLAIVLVDPPVTNFTMSPTSYRSISPSQPFAVLPYQGGYVDFAEMRKPVNNQQHDFRDCRNPTEFSVGNTFDDLLRYWQIQARDGLFSLKTGSAEKPTTPTTSTPSLPTIARPCLQLAAAETSNTFAYFSSILSSSSPASICAQHPIPNVVTLQRALSRTIAIDAFLTAMKSSLMQTKEFACSSSTSSTSEHVGATYRTLLSNLHAHRSTTEATFSHLTALLTSTHTATIAELSQTSSTSQSHLRLLGILALIYVPLSLACLIFSLPDTLLPSRHYIYGFLPITVGVILLFILLGVPELRRGLLTIKDRICGGLTKREVLKGERFKVHRETGEKTWVNYSSASRPQTEFGFGPYTMGAGPPTGGESGQDGIGQSSGTFAETKRAEREQRSSPSSGGIRSGSVKSGRVKTRTRERKREAWDEV